MVKYNGENIATIKHNGNDILSIMQNGVELYSFKKDPVLVKLIDNPGIDQTYTFPSGYKYVDMLLVGAGGPGGSNGGGGGSSGNIVYVKDFILSKLSNRTITYNIAKKGTSSGIHTYIVIDNTKIYAFGGVAGSSGVGASGRTLSNTDSNYVSFTQYVTNLPTNVNICNNGGGSSQGGGGQLGGASGASCSSNGANGTRDGASGVQNSDGFGGYSGGTFTYITGEIGETPGGTGYRINDLIIPIVSVFQGGGLSGGGTYRRNSSGGASGYGSGGSGGYDAVGGDGEYGSGGGGGANGFSGGSGGQGIICFYLHN